jgi:hypothetical protein
MLLRSEYKIAVLMALFKRFPGTYMMHILEYEFYNLRMQTRLPAAPLQTKRQ